MDPMDRNRHADLLRVGAMCVVVLGHWLVTDVTYARGQLSGLDALGYVSWARWLTLALQVMPVFFLVGGYVNALSWTRYLAGRDGAVGAAWAWWVRHRALRLLVPATGFVVVAEVAVELALAAGAPAAEVAEAGWVTGLQLWFLPVYLLLIALTPALLAAHRRFGLAVPAAAAAGAALVDVAVIGWHLPVLGFANYLLVWGCVHQLGFAWQDGRLARPPWRPWALAAGGAAALAALLTAGPFPVDMIDGAGPVRNTSPPSVALLALAAAQTGLLVVAEPAGDRLLAKASRWRLVSRLNDAAMTVYLWHMVPVVVVAVALFPRGLAPQPAIGSLAWWALRPAWLAVLGVVLVPIAAAAMPLDRLRTPRWPPNVERAGRWRAVLLGLGLAAALVGLARIAITGFAPGGRLPAADLALYACGFAATLTCGWIRRGERSAPSQPQDQAAR
jgi:fucose 4-O-acetylase-like acetyltransferase